MLTIPHLLTRRSFVAQTGQWLGGLALASSFPLTTTSGAKNLKQLVAALYAAYANLDMEKLLACFAEDGWLEDATLHFKIEGKNKLREFFVGQRPFFLSVKFEVKTLLINGPYAISLHRQSGSVKQGLVPNVGPFQYAVEGISIFEFDGEKIKRQTDFYDVLTFRKQSGQS